MMGEEEGEEIAGEGEDSRGDVAFGGDFADLDSGVEGGVDDGCYGGGCVGEGGLEGYGCCGYEAFVMKLVVMGCGSGSGLEGVVAVVVLGHGDKMFASIRRIDVVKKK